MDSDKIEVTGSLVSHLERQERRNAKIRTVIKNFGPESQLAFLEGFIGAKVFISPKVIDQDPMLRFHFDANQKRFFCALYTTIHTKTCGRIEVFYNKTFTLSSSQVVSILNDAFDKVRLSKAPNFLRELIQGATQISA